MKAGGKEMENQQEAMNMMMMMFERMLQEQREMSEITTVVQRLVQQNGQFDGKDVSRYLRDYKMEMLRYGISERLQVLSFNRVATDELQERIHEIRQQSPMWESFEEAIRDTYDYLRPKRTRTWSTNGGQQWVKSGHRLPPKESLMRKGSEMHEKSQVDIEGELKTEPKSRPTKDEEEEDRGRKGIPTPVPETSAAVPVHQRETGETECVGGKVEDRKGNEEDKVNEHERRDSFTIVSETSVLEPGCRHNTEDKESGGNETKVEADAYEGEIAKENMAMGETTEDDNTEDSYPLILETSAVVSENQRETGETGGGNKEGKVGSRFGWKMIRLKFRCKQKHDNAKVGSTMGEACNTEHALRHQKKHVLRRKEKHTLRRKKKHALRCKNKHALRGNTTHALRWNTKHALRPNTTHAQHREIKHALKPHKDLTASAYSEVDIDAWVEPTEDKRGVERDNTPRCSRVPQGTMTTTHGNAKNEQRIWWIGWRQWFGWKEWVYSKWRDKVDIAGQTEDEGETTSIGNFGTYRRMCGFGGGECRSVFRTLREKVKII